MTNFEKSTPNVLELRNVSKNFTIRYDNSLKERLIKFGKAANKEEFNALSDISLNLSAGHTIGLIGHNGSGKSTLLKIIGGIIEPSSGQVRRRGRVAALLELGAGFHPDLTGRENIYMNAAILGMTKRDTDNKFDEIVEFSGIKAFIDTQVKFYSSGMYVRLGFAVAVHTNPDILLVDEVLTVGDEAFQRKCLEKIQEFQSDGRTIILVTHNLSQVVDMCDRAILLDHGHVVMDGNPHAAVEEFRRLLENGDTSSGLLRSEIETKIVTVKLLNHPDNTVKVGDSLELEIELEPFPDLKQLICAIFITDKLGNPVFGTSARVDAKETGLGSSVARFNLYDLRFAEGTYAVNLTLANGANHIHIENRPKALLFRVTAPKPTQGVVYLEAEGSISLSSN